MENNKYNYDEIYTTYDFSYFFSCMEYSNVPSNCNPVPIDYVAEWFRDNDGDYIDGDKDPIIELAKDLVKSGCDTLVYNGDVITHSMSAEDYADEIRHYIIKEPSDYDYDEEDEFNNYYDEDDYDYDEDDDEDDDEEDDEELDDPFYDEDEDIEEYYENRLDDCLKW